MIVNPIKTHKITGEDNDLLKILDQYITELAEESILVITSKIVAITQGRIVKTTEANKLDLIKQESQLYLDPDENKYNVALTITDNILIASAGIDESNGNGYYVLWPENPQEVAKKVKEYLQKKFNLKKVGVILTDSRTTPLRWGITVFGLASSGFNPLNNLIGTQDIFGRELIMTKVNMADSLAASAGTVMGEGIEQTPLAIIKNIPFVEFSDSDPDPSELKIDIEDDIYAPLLNSVKWHKGDK